MQPVGLVNHFQLSDLGMSLEAAVACLLFRRQIDTGGPVTVTHPDMERYFMTTQSCTWFFRHPQWGKVEVFVPNMGNSSHPRTALDLIRLSVRASKDIEIVFTDPGEKLREALWDEGADYLHQPPRCKNNKMENK
jgi:FlaA1/EpsC-like NDP-sugar epimerase